MKNLIPFKQLFKIRLILVASVFALLLSSCSLQNYASFSAEKKDNIALGMNKSDFVNMLGKPLAIKSYKELGNDIDVLIYVDNQYFRTLEYIVESRYVFENSILIRIDEEPYLPKNYTKKDK